MLATKQNFVAVLVGKRSWNYDGIMPWEFPFPGEFTGHQASDTDLWWFFNFQTERAIEHTLHLPGIHDVNSASCGFTAMILVIYSLCASDSIIGKTLWLWIEHADAIVNDFHYSLVSD